MICATYALLNQVRTVNEMNRLPILLLTLSLLLIADTLVAQSRSRAELPEGPAKGLVQATCLSCHGARNITRSAGYSSTDEWRKVMGSMVTMSEDDAVTIAEYLLEHFPENPERRPTLVEGNLEIEFEEWTVPTLGQRSRDPIEAGDGSIWWTGMWGNLVGHLDPETGEMKEYPLPPGARPHSIVPDEKGYIWYTGNSNATIGKLDPGTGEIIEYKTKGRDPHTATFHPNGKLFFTSQGAGMLGRLDPRNGEIKEIDTESRPYGIQVADDGTVWVAYNGTNKIGALDPESMEVKYYDLPEARSRVRRLGLSSDGMVWFVNSSMGRIGRLNPGTGEIKEWDSPSGVRSHPYALAVIDDKVWYNESGMRPDALVRFDPETEKFQSWAIPSGVGIVRNMWVTKDNELLIHQSSSNRIGRVTIKGLPN